MPTETEDSKTETDKGAEKLEADKAAKAKPEADKGADKASADAKAESDKADAEKAKAAEDRKRQREIDSAAAKAVEEYKKQAAKEAEEAAELAKKSDAEKAQAAQRKLEAQLADLKAEAAANKMAADLAHELMDQGLAPASPKAREHITAAYKAQIAAGKDPADALKAVKAEEAYLFKAPPVVEPAPAAKAKTGAADKGPTVTGADKTQTGQKNLGDVEDPAEFRRLARERHGITLVG